VTTPLESHAVFAAGAGVATFLSPCALPLLPGYVGYYASDASDGRQPLTGIAARGLAAAGGALAALGLLAGLAVLVGRPVTSRLPLLEPLVGVGLLGLGAVALWPRGPDLHVPLPARRRSLRGFAAFGGAYGGASAGCVLPVFLAVVVQAVTLGPLAAATVVGVYAGSVALPLFVVTILTGLGVDLATGRLAGAGARLERAAGVVLLAAGVGQLVVAFAPESLPALPV
jgi:cytochrome c-type biogenesis protein